MSEGFLKYFKVRERQNGYIVYSLQNILGPRELDEWNKIVAMIYFQSQRHIELNLEKTEFVFPEFFSRLLFQSLEYREKKRTLAISKAPKTISHFLHARKLENLLVVLSSKRSTPI